MNVSVISALTNKVHNTVIFITSDRVHDMTFVYLFSLGKQWGSTHSRGLDDPVGQRAQTPVQHFGRGSVW